MSDSLAVWRDSQISKAYGLLDQGGVTDGEFYLSTPIGLAAPSFYQGDPAFLERLGPRLMGLQGKLGRLSVSRILATTTGCYSQRSGGEVVLLSTWERGPACDPHNNFELFTVLAGLAHFHRVTSQAEMGTMPNWRAFYSRLRTELPNVKHPNLNKRALTYWEGLVETWRICLDEGLDILGKIAQSDLTPSLVLGVQSFNDFVYLADLHMVHYNPVARCHWNSPVVDVAMLLLSTEGDVRLAKNMLLSYEKVRNLSLAEKQLVLAYLWFPREVTLAELQAPELNILGIKRMQSLLELKIGLISDIEELLLPPRTEDELHPFNEDEEDDVDMEKEVFQVNPKAAKKMQVERPAGTALAVDLKPEQVAILRVQAALNPVLDILGIVSTAEGELGALSERCMQAEPVEEVRLVEEERVLIDQEVAEEVLPREDPRKEEQEPVKPAKKTLIWKPFPRPLNAPPEAVVTPTAVVEKIPSPDEDPSKEIPE